MLCTVSVMGLWFVARAFDVNIGWLNICMCVVQVLAVGSLAVFSSPVCTAIPVHPDCWLAVGMWEVMVQDWMTTMGEHFIMRLHNHSSV